MIHLEYHNKSEIIKVKSVHVWIMSVAYSKYCYLKAIK